MVSWVSFISFFHLENKIQSQSSKLKKWGIWSHNDPRDDFLAWCRTTKKISRFGKTPRPYLRMRSKMEKKTPAVLKKKHFGHIWERGAKQTNESDLLSLIFGSCATLAPNGILSRLQMELLHLFSAGTNLQNTNKNKKILSKFQNTTKSSADSPYCT